jgi:RND family efflux transporter MFP subunit
MSTRIPIVLTALLMACSAPPPEGPPETEDGPAAIEARVRVRVEAAEARPLAGSDALTGVVEPFARVVVAAETAARVVARHVERGDRVEADALLYTLDNSRARIEYRRAQATVEARRSDVEQARSELDRSNKLRARESISAAAHDRASHAAGNAEASEELARISKRAASRSLRDAKIRAPFAGTVAEFHADRGDFVGPGAPVVTLVDLSRVRLRVGLTAAELELARVGARVPVRFADLGGVVVDAELRSVSPLVDPRTGTYATELWLDNPDERLRQGMLGRVELAAVASESGDVLTVPRQAVIRRGPDYAVWVVDDSLDPPRVEARALVLGRADRDRIAVLDGLAAGEAVVIEGMFALREGAAVVVEND